MKGRLFIFMPTNVFAIRVRCLEKGCWISTRYKFGFERTILMYRIYIGSYQLASLIKIRRIGYVLNESFPEKIRYLILYNNFFSIALDVLIKIFFLSIGVLNYYCINEFKVLKCRLNTFINIKYSKNNFMHYDIRLYFN